MLRALHASLCLLATLLATLLSGWPCAAGAGTIFGSSGYYALLEFRVAGNGAFFDEFEAGGTNTPPTSLFTPLAGSVVSEAYSIGGIGRPAFEGQLALTASDGAEEGILGAPATDFLFEGYPLEDGEGDGTIDATFLVGFAAPGSSESFGIGTAESDTYYPTNLMFPVSTGDDVSMLPPACAVPNAVLMRFTNAAFDFACDVVDLQALSGALVMRLEVDDATDTVTPSYSIDGGTTFASGATWDVPAVPGAVWTYSFFVFPSVFAFYEVPEPDGGGVAAFACVALLARRRAARG